ncbi:hypothetical protein DS745_23185 [Anaerobacillus alkaliphilus]|uniref:ECF transporter S component n=1 Tax=Anaerobacillus alkaliphilus TaxID=1548597 RepID=A0A4Q0VMI2_9BACI|nr:hypothetical protein [Anaerobacillus alkaliphilus]RXI96607.1 hypothetical protein DS745_23185 [Anaerobacillus alkaliphilus]
MYWRKNLKDITVPISKHLDTQKSTTYKLVYTALLGLLAAILQSAGGFIPVIGMLISPLATFPIVIAILMAGLHGLLGYFVTLFLLLIIQPSELLIFGFTTGLLAVGLGIGFRYFMTRWKIIVFSALVLTVGICFLLYTIQFPILGPFLLEFQYVNIVFIYLFSFLYSWGWTELLVFKILPTAVAILEKNETSK